MGISIDVFIYAAMGDLKMALLDLHPSTKIEWIKNAYWAATGVKEGSYGLSSMDLFPSLDEPAPACLTLEDVRVLDREIHLRIVPTLGGLTVSHSPDGTRCPTPTAEGASLVGR